MSKNNFMRMMMFRGSEKNRNPEHDRWEEDRDSREREMERRLRKLEEDEEPRRAWRIEEQNRYIDPYPKPRYPDVEYRDRRMPQIGFSQTGDWDRYTGDHEYGGAESRSIKMPHAHLSRDEAEKWCKNMVNADGTKGPHWTLDQTSSAMSQRGINCDKADFFAAMNMMYSDYCMVARAYSADNQNFYADMASAFLNDKDAVPGKIVEYHDVIADR